MKQNKKYPQKRTKILTTHTHTDTHKNFPHLHKKLAKKQRNKKKNEKCRHGWVSHTQIG